ncbi:MAG: hypothetical protein M1829_000519 [Trizodia sp. TS-e1964]|nr:MAG: hypothetical protein M1829_000519 [Trizodia sp. TS-e1964]
MTLITLTVCLLAFSKAIASNKYILDLHFTIPGDKSSVKLALPSGAKLSFLSAVNPTLIPLYLAAGPVLNVATGNVQTEKWLELFFREPANGLPETAELPPSWRENCQLQSDVGLLLQVQYRGQIEKSKTVRITEILVYAAAAAAEDIPAAGSLITPPRSSPSVHDDSTGKLSNLANLTLLALPLSSDLLYRPLASDPQCLEDSNQRGELNPTLSDDATNGGAPTLVEVTARFLPPICQGSNFGETSPSLKRKRVNSLFDDAAEKRKKANKKGGESVSQYMALPSNQLVHNHNLPIPAKASCTDLKKRVIHGLDISSRPKSSDGLPKLPSSRPRALRSLSLSSSNSQFEPDIIKPTQNESRRSNLSLVTTPGIEEEEEEEKSTIEKSNKDALSKILMAGMRLYGLQQRKKPKTTDSTSSSSSNTLPPIEASIGATHPIPTEPEDPDEFKLIYYQAFKGACFALRRHMHCAPIKQADLRDIVDRFLALFCNNPLDSLCMDVAGPPVVSNSVDQTLPLSWAKP